MNRRFLYVFTLSAISFFAFQNFSSDNSGLNVVKVSSVPNSPRMRVQGAAKGRILVMPKAGLSIGNFSAALALVGGKPHKLGHSNLHVVDLPTGASESAAVAKLLSHPDIKFAELDKEVTPNLTANDPYFSSEWHLSRIGVPAAWDISQGQGITIAILDSGVDASDVDLQPNLVPGYNFYDNNTNTADVCGHGTAVAGTAAAVTNNGIGVSGVAGQAKIMPIRIAYYDTTRSECYAYFSTVASGLTYAADHGARIANVSYGGLAGSAAVQNAAQYMKSKNGLVFVSAGNSGVNEGFAATSTMIPVSATDQNDNMFSWSSFGPYVALSAPGQAWTTSMGGIYQLWSGTSFSSPITAGVGALMMAANPNLDNLTIENLLYSTAVDFGGTGRDIYFGYGRVNAVAAVQAAANSGHPPPDTTPPVVSIASPTANSTVSGSVSINVNATDNVGVTKVQLSVNGTIVATDTAAPFSFSWDSTSMANGSATLVATAFDAAGNSAASNPIMVTVSNTIADTTPPVVSITSPTANSTVSGSVSVNVNATDNVGVTKVQLSVNGVVVATNTAAPFSFSWNSTSVANSSVTLVATAFDAAGNSKASNPVTVNVSNTIADTTPPTVSIASPTANSTVSGTVSINVNATDNVGVTKVQLSVNGVVVATDTAAPFSFSWNSTSVANGSVTLVATAFDAAGNAKASNPVSVKVSNADKTPPVITIASPAAGTVTGNIIITSNATDNSGAAGITQSIYIDNVRKATGKGATLSYNWNTRSMALGLHTIKVTAKDAAGNSSSSSVQVTSK